MQFKFEVSIEVERSGSGKFASREEIAEKILEHLNEEPDCSGCGPDGDTDYDVTNCEAVEIDPAVEKGVAVIRAALGALSHEAVAAHNASIRYPQLFRLPKSSLKIIAKLARKVNKLRGNETFHLATRAYVTRSERDRRAVVSDVVFVERRKVVDGRVIERREHNV